MKKTYISPSTTVYVISSAYLMATSLNGGQTGNVTVNEGIVKEGDFTDAARNNGTSSIWNKEW